MTSSTVIRFYKPYGVLTKFTDEEGRPTLSDYINMPEIYAAGRLDLDSEGLLLLTNDNRLNHRLTDPRYEHPRTYWVQVEHIPDAQAIRHLEQGVIIKGYKTLPATVKLLDSEPNLPPRNPPVRFRKSIPTAWLEMTLIEGKNRQVRRMTASVGFPTLRLVRVAIGPIRLDGLQEGMWAKLSEAEQTALWQSVKSKDK